MNITDILEAIKKNPELAGQLFQNITNIEGGQSFIEKANKAYFQENFNTEVSKIYNGIDEDIFSLTGKRKESSQKTFDFVKQTISELKAKAEEQNGKTPEDVKALKQTIKDLEEKVKNGESSEHWKNSYNELKEQLVTIKTEYETKIEDLNKSNIMASVENDIATSLAGLKFNSNLPKSVVDVMINNAKESLKSTAKVIDGKVVYYDKDGKVLRNKLFDNASASELLAESLKDILDSSDNSGGGGAPTKIEKGTIQINGVGDNATKKLLLNTESFTSKLGFQKVAEETLLAQGVVRGSQDWYKLKDEAYAEYKVSDLPRE